MHPDVTPAMITVIPLNTATSACDCGGESNNAAGTPLLTRLVLCACAAIGMARASAAEVWIITDAEHPVTAIAGARRIELDGPRRIQAELTAQLPPDPARAEELARQRLKDGGATLQKRFVSTYQGVVDAWSLGITQVPAVLVDRRYVVYGDPDAAHAVSLIQKYRSLHR